MITAIIVIGITYSGTYVYADWQDTREASEGGPWFAAYVDVTSTPAYAFEKRGVAAAPDNVVLSFIVASPSAPCTPTWGGYYTLDEAAAMLDLDRRIARLQQQGGRIAISFGGLLNSELGLACEDPEALRAAYTAVIERYGVNTIDLDLEGEGLRNAAALARRAEVIADLQESYREQGASLAVWLTLPVIPQGLTKEGTDAVAVMLKHGVDLAGVNIMTMDYGEARDEKDSMYHASRKAMIETHRQLGILYAQAGVPLNKKSLWKKIAATPMIGQNDVVGEIFTLEDAVALNAFAREQGAGRMSMWSANRDIPCSENYVDVKIVSDVCSGVSSPAFAFARALGQGFEGSLVQGASIVTIADTDSNEPIIDNPLTSPYQIWREAGVYLKGTKVVWHGTVYEAKWWTKGDFPDNPLLQSSDSPWQLIGPVLPGDKPVQLLTLPPGTYSSWDGYAVYNEGDRVLFDGMPYEAKWWNQGESPAAAAVNPDNSPWQMLTQDQIAAIREARGI
jgi:chitinase